MENNDFVLVIQNVSIYPLILGIIKSNGLIPPNMRRHSNVLFRSHIGRDVADHAETSS